MTIHSLTREPGRGAAGLLWRVSSEPKGSRCRRACRYEAGYWLILALAWASLSVAAADRNYTVKRHDTLTELAQKYGLTVSELAEHNGLKKTDKLRLGQK